MPFYVKDGGSWKLADLYVRDGGSWKPVTAEVRDGGAWKRYSNPIVSPNTSNMYRFRSSGTCYCGIRFHYDHGEDSLSATGSWEDNARGNWLDAGHYNEVWVQRVISSGSLSVDAGSGRMLINTVRNFYVYRSAAGSKVCTLTFNFYDAASGGNLIGTSGAVTFEAEQGTA